MGPLSFFWPGRENLKVPSYLAEPSATRPANPVFALRSQCAHNVPGPSCLRFAGFPPPLTVIIHALKPGRTLMVGFETYE